jgi:hypothetical protein
MTRGLTTTGATYVGLLTTVVFLITVVFVAGLETVLVGAGLGGVEARLASVKDEPRMHTSMSI